MADDNAHPERVRFPEGKAIDQFVVQKHIGSGGYGDIYAVFDTTSNNRLCAMKVEFLAAEKQGLVDELQIMMNLRGSLFFPELIADGVKDDFRYLVMELLGPAVSSMRRILLHHRYTLYSTMKLSIEMLNAIREFHKRGFVHRDIKPGNFLIRPCSRYPICLIDFGLSETYINPQTGQHIPPNPSAGFTGTCRYASLHAHEEKQLSRRDDLFSWFYSVIELIESKVPWPGSRDRELTVQMKRTITSHELCHSLPNEFIEIWKYIKKLKFKQEPNYHWIKTKINNAIKILNANNPKYDWELLEKNKIEAISMISLEFIDDEGGAAGQNHDEMSSSEASPAGEGCVACTIA